MSKASSAAALGTAAAVVLGLLLPVMMAPATKSSPLFLAVAAALALMAVVVSRGFGRVLAEAASALRTPAGLTASALLAFMGVSVMFAHAPRASAQQFGQFAAVVLAGLVLSLALPHVAPRRRALLFAGGVIVAAALMLADLKGGLWLRELTGGRVTTYTYNRGLVTLAVLVWPVLALVVAARKLWLILPLAVLLPLAVRAGDSATAAVALLAGIAVFPIAVLVPRFARRAGLALTIIVLAVQPWIGTIMRNALPAAVHQRMEDAHSDDRVRIWLSFEEAARANWITGNGFGSSLNMQNAPVAGKIAPERVTLLGASHPHNGWLQIWVELGLVGAVLAAALAAFLFGAIGRMRPALQPFALTCFATAALVTLVSHGAWQAWWWAAIFASVAGFAMLERDLRRGEPPA